VRPILTSSKARSDVVNCCGRAPKGADWQDVEHEHSAVHVMQIGSMAIKTGCRVIVCGLHRLHGLTDLSSAVQIMDNGPRIRRGFR